MKKYLFAVIFVLASIIAVGTNYIQHLKKEHDRLSNNQKVLLENTIRYYKTKTGMMAASSQALVLEIKDLKTSRRELLDSIHTLGIKNRDIQSIISTVMTVKKDSNTAVPLVNTTFNNKPAKTYSYKDQYLTLSGIIQNDSIRPAMNTIVPLTQVVHEVPRYFLGFIRVRPKEVRITTKSTNPYVTIMSQELIRIEK
ncbi:MAG: hypothetical protein M0R37_04000 [Bacteroidales bacterium]|nr:hypothetical protein [Bacteroidales bacterium]